MVSVRAFALVLLLCSGAAFAQEREQVRLALNIADQTGARIPGAHIIVTNDATAARFEVRANSSAEAALRLDKGNYSLRVEARGFQVFEQRSVAITNDVGKTVTLLIPNMVECGPCVSAEGGPSIDPEKQLLLSEIPLLRVEQLTLPSKRIRPKARWF
jgi:hypothetical protein